jgi:hypothetical protein
VNIVVSKPIPQLIGNTDRFRTGQYSFRGRLALLSVVFLIIGWLWPYEISGLASHLSNTGWVLGWFTVLVLLGAVSGYALRSRWAILISPLTLLAGGIVHWFQFEWGLQAPPFPMFALVAVMAFGVLLITAGTAAGIASRVAEAELEAGRPATGIRRSAAFAALLGLLALTSMYVLPMPYIGALLGFGALLAGLGLLEEDQVNKRERLLAIAGMMVGLIAIATQIYSLWSLIKNLW